MTQEINQYDPTGEKHGYWEEFSLKQSLVAKGNYVNGMRDGIWKTYRNDVIEFSIDVCRGKPHCFSTYYNKDGSIDRQLLVLI